METELEALLAAFATVLSGVILELLRRFFRLTNEKRDLEQCLNDSAEALHASCEENEAMRESFGLNSPYSNWDYNGDDR